MKIWRYNYPTSNFRTYGVRRNNKWMFVRIWLWVGTVLPYHTTVLYSTGFVWTRSSSQQLDQNISKKRTKAQLFTTSKLPNAKFPDTKCFRTKEVQKIIRTGIVPIRKINYMKRARRVFRISVSQLDKTLEHFWFILNYSLRSFRRMLIHNF